jgi:hypothetical protein
LSTKLEFTFAQGWTQSRTYRESTKVTVPPGTYGWVVESPVARRVKFTFTIRANNQTYIIPDLVISAPITDKEAKDQHSPSVVDLTQSRALPANYCTQSNPPALTTLGPPQIDPMMVYGIAPAQSNQRVMTMLPPDQTDKITLTGWRGATDQLFQFEPSTQYAGYYLIRGDSNLNYCLDQWVEGARLIRYWCTGALKQLWKPVWNQDGTGFELVSRDNAKLVGVDPDGALVMLDPSTKGVPLLWQLNSQ